MSITTKSPLTPSTQPTWIPEGPNGHGEQPPAAPPQKTGTGSWRGFSALLILILLAAVVVESTATKSSAAATSPATTFEPATANGHVVNVSLTAVETTQLIVPASAGGPLTYSVWTFNGTTPAPVIRVHLGDTVHFVLHNASRIGMQHSIDFHAAMTPWANLPSGSGSLSGNYQPVNPGQTKTFTWTAMFPGVFMYHCGVQPVLEHIANGMYGAIVVEPNNLPAEREYVLVNSEFYPGAAPVGGIYYGDYNAMLAADPKYVVWNGVADQYKASPLVVRPNEKFRLWVVNAGPTLTSAFHVIGTMFNSYADGNPANVVYGDQTYNIAPGGAAMFELQIPDAGLYPFVTHAFAYTGRGAVGLIRVDPKAPAPPTSYPTMGDPFSAGVKAFTPPAAVASVIAPGGATATVSPSARPSATASTSAMPGMSATPAASASASASAPTAACSPNGTLLKVTALNTAFNTSCLAAPANTAFTIAFTNSDPGIPHNVAIYTNANATTKLFGGELITGPATATYKVPALKPGVYYFRCDVHPGTMYGTFVVR